MEGMSCSFVSIFLSLPLDPSLSLSLSRLGLSRLHSWLDGRNVFFIVSMCCSPPIFTCLHTFDMKSLFLSVSNTHSHTYSCSYCRKINCVIEKPAVTPYVLCKKSFNQTFGRCFIQCWSSVKSGFRDHLHKILVCTKITFRHKCVCPLSMRVHQRLQRWVCLCLHMCMFMREV